jgi:outer membrane receptor protein involved in Fe transport
MKNPTHSSRAAACLCAALAVSPLALAQAVAPRPPAAAEEVIKLDEFTVSGAQTSGYRATNSITATGIGAQISEVPLPITIVTSELIADTAGFELREALNFVPGVLTNPRGESTFVVRGFSGLISYRNGQYRRQLFTSYNVDRVEVVKGPASIFFGAVRPGGVINYVTTKPVFTSTFTDVKLQFGVEDFYKVEIFHNQKISDKLALRVGVVAVDAGGTRPFEYKDESFLALSASWRPTPNQLLTVDLENINRKLFYLSSYGGRALSNSRYLFNPAVPRANQNSVAAQTDLQNYLRSLGNSTTPGAANFVPTFDIFAPIYGPGDPYGYSVSFSHDAQQRQDSRSADVDYLLKIGDSLVWTTNANYAFDDTAGLQPSDNEQRPYADGTVRFRTEDFINVRDSYNFDNKLTWRFDLGGTKHTLQIGQEYQKVVFTRPGWFDSANRYNNSPGNSGTTAFVTNYRAGIDAPVSLETIQRNSGQTFNIVRRNWEVQQSYFIANQSRLFDERLILLYGARRNDFHQRTWYSRPTATSSKAATSPGGLSQDDYSKPKGGWTPQGGALFKVLPGVALFATYSEAIEPNYTIDADGRGSNPIESDSIDAGVKLELAGGRFSSTLAYYDLERGNLAYNDTVKQTATGRAPYFIYGNSERSEGIEWDFNWSPNDSYQVVGGWAHFLNAYVSKSNVAANIGQPLSYTPKNTFTLWNRYSFRNGPLNGFVVGLGGRHNDAARISSDPINVVRNPSFTVFDAMVAYRLRVQNRDFRAQLNVKNLTDKRYREGADGFFGEARNIYLSLSTRL